MYVNSALLGHTIIMLVAEWFCSVTSQSSDVWDLARHSHMNCIVQGGVISHNMPKQDGKRVVLERIQRCRTEHRREWFL